MNCNNTILALQRNKNFSGLEKYNRTWTRIFVFYYNLMSINYQKKIAIRIVRKRVIGQHLHYKYMKKYIQIQIQNIYIL